MLANGKNLFWLANPCTSSPTNTCLFTEEENTDQPGLVYLRNYLMAPTTGTITGLAWLGSIPAPLESLPPEDIYLLSAFVGTQVEAQLKFKPPPLQYFQSAVEFRKLQYDVTVSNEGREVAKLKTDDTSLVLKQLVPGTAYQITVSACWLNGWCSSGREETGTTIANLTPGENAFFHSLNGRINLLGRFEITPPSGLPSSYSCYAYDKQTNRRYVCLGDQIIRVETRTSFPLATVAGLRSIALQPERAVLYATSEFSITVLRLTGSRVKTISFCSINQECKPVLGVVADDVQTDKFSYLLREDANVTLYSESMEHDNSKTFVASSDQDFPTTTSMVFHGGKILFTTIDGKAGGCARNLKELIYYSSEPLVDRTFGVHISTSSNVLNRNLAVSLRTVSLTKPPGQRKLR